MISRRSLFQSIAAGVGLALMRTYPLVAKMPEVAVPACTISTISLEEFVRSRINEKLALRMNRHFFGLDR